MWDRIHSRISNTQKLITELWLSFLMAGAGSMTVFVLFDPDIILHCLNLADMNRTGAYTIVFFFFWVLTSCTSLLTTLFLESDNARYRNNDG